MKENISEFLIRNSGKKIIFTNGCFDILHLGHIDYLRKARYLGDVLIIGLNSDTSIKKIKGIQRPINNQNSRKILLEELRSVDYVEIFDEETPLRLIEFIKPSVLVKGSDYKIDNVVGASEVRKMGGEVILIPYLDNFSTTIMIKKILDLNDLSR